MERDVAIAAIEKLFTDGKLLRSSGQNDAADAIRHAFFSFNLTRYIDDADVAKQFSDAHEISVPDPDSERLMGLYNNRIGRLLALDPANANRDPMEVIFEAYKKGLLRTSSFNAGSR